ncbi:aminotransferase class I/II-fold pyridoxal phosphate-dependent enzyme [Phytohabitans kaempferiae]|uniref:8-amino-7-oxononanoate synthase n=1 Tax=Phytohabitans kaempferiae TaxID=1620943 RepID=A0ABV6MG86_9ACTN
MSAPLARGRADAGTSAPAYVSRWTELERLLATNPMMDAVIDEVRGREIRVGDHWLVDFASCNYLGFDLEPEIQEAIGPAVARWGTHPSWSRMLGSPLLYPRIEERLTDLLGAPDTLVLPTVTLIHMAVVPVLAGTGTVIYEHNAHRTIFDACQYARGLGATAHRFRAGDLEQLEQRLRAAPTGGPRLVCVDGVNSMTGNPPDLPAYARLCREYGALLYVDDAHGFGLLGERRPDETSPYGSRGNAVVRWFGESYDNVVLVGGFSKAYSSLLAFIAVPTEVKEHLKVAAPPYLYSGPSPTASLATVLAGFDVNEARGDALRGRLYTLSRRVLDRVRELGLATPNTSGTPIIELPLAAGRELSDVADELWRRGVYVTLAAYPLVARADVGLRVQLTATHTDEDVERLLAALEALADRGDLRAAGGQVAPRQARPGPDS